MIKLLHNNGYILDYNVISRNIERTINGDYFLEFELPVDYDIANLIEDDMEIEASIPNNDTDLFRVRLIRKDLDTIYFYCTQVFFSLEDNLIEDTNIVNKNGLGAILQISGATQYPHNFKFFSNIGTINTARMVRKNVVTAILGDEDNSFISRWGGELDIHKYDVKMLTEIGLDRGVRIEYKKNLTGLDGTIDYSTYYTRCMPKGYDGLLLDEKYVDSANINLEHPIIRVVEFPEIKVKENEEDEGFNTIEEAKQALREAAIKLFEQGADIPTASYEINFIELTSTEEYKNYSILESIWIGDTVTIKHDMFDIKARCVHYSYDPIAKSYNSISLGDISGGIIEINNDIKDELDKVIDSNKDEFSKVLDAAIKEATDLINQGLGGHAYKTRNEFLILDTEDIMTAKKVLRINQNGIGFSSTGYNGPYSTALTSNGKLVITEVTAEKFVASLIEGGILRSVNGKLEFNLDSEVFRITHSESSTSTMLDTKGFYIEDENGETIASLASKESWTELKADKIFAKNIENIYLGDSNLYVDHNSTNTIRDGSITYPFTSFTQLKYYLKATPIINKSVNISILTNSSINEQFHLSNLKGEGEIKIIFDKNFCLRGNSNFGYCISIDNCDLSINIHGGRTSYNSNDGAFLDGTVNGIIFVNCRYAVVNNICINSTTYGVVFNNTNGLTARIDLCDTPNGITSTGGSQIHDNDSCGNCATNYRAQNAGITMYGGEGNGMKPLGSIREQSGKVIELSARGGQASYRNKPPIPPTMDYVREFNHMSLATYNYAWSNWSVGECKQGEYASYGNKAGHAFFDIASIRNFIGSGTIKSSTITVTRKNAGGSSGQVAIYLNSSTANSASGTPTYSNNTYLGTLSWNETKTFTLPISIINSLKNGTSNSLAFYSSSNSKAYAEPVSIKLTIKVNK